MWLIRLLIGFWLFSFHFFVANTQGAAPPYLQELIKQAVREKLYEQRYWHLHTPLPVKPLWWSHQRSGRSRIFPGSQWED